MEVKEGVIKASLEVSPYDVNGEKYFSVQQFAYLVNRSNQTIYRLIKEGNALRKLTCVHILGKPLIPIAELDTFPFCASGPNGKLSAVNYKGEYVGNEGYKPAN